MTEDQFAGWRSWCELEAIGTAAGLSAPLLVLALDGAVRHLRGETCVLEAMRPVGGGSIHRAFVLECSGARFFAKVNDAAQRANFRAEANGLSALQGAGVRVPTTFSEGNGPGFAYLLLEYLDVVPLDGSAARALGRALARLHAREAGTRFGWECANYIGSTVQQNGWHDDWSGFWCEERMAPQLALAHQNGFSARLQSLGERLLARIPALLAGHRPKPSLVHGDLWSGNAGALVSGDPVMFDPAVYVGDAEVDLAMTELFGGFPRAFYEGYAESIATPAGYEARKPLYNLYHVLNHANMFGGGYVAQAETMMAQLLR